MTRIRTRIIKCRIVALHEDIYLLYGLNVFIERETIIMNICCQVFLVAVEGVGMMMMIDE